MCTYLSVIDAKMISVFSQKIGKKIFLFLECAMHKSLILIYLYEQIKSTAKMMTGKFTLHSKLQWTNGQEFGVNFPMLSNTDKKKMPMQATASGNLCIIL